MQRVVVSPYTHGTESIIQDEPNEQYNSCSILSFCQHEMEVVFWLLLVTVMIFGSFIPAFDIWISVFRHISMWEAVPVAALDLALQTLTWTSLALILFLLSTGFNTTVETQKPWQIPLYIVDVPTSWTVDIWSLQSVLHGSPMSNCYVHLLLGVKIRGCRRTLLFPMRIFDGTCITIADQTIVDDANLTGHYSTIWSMTCVRNITLRNICIIQHNGIK